MNSEVFCCFERVTFADNGCALEVGDNAVDNFSLVKGNRVRIKSWADLRNACECAIP